MPTAVAERRTQCVRIEPKLGEPIRIALAYSDDLIMSNDAVYKGGIYAQPTGTSSTITGAPTVIDFGSVYDADSVTVDQVQSGYWDGARIFLFCTDWALPVEDEEDVIEFTLGKITDDSGSFVAELMSKLDLLNQAQGRSCTQGCTYVLGDAHVDGSVIASDKSRCNVSTSIVGNISSSITSITNQMQFNGSDLFSIYPDDWFAFGEILFTSGLNSGLPYRYVAEYVEGGGITLAQPFYYPVQVGDEFLIRAGCRKRFQQDCITKYGNGVHFGGFPHVPQRSSVMKFGGQ